MNKLLLTIIFSIPLSALYKESTDWRAKFIEELKIPYRRQLAKLAAETHMRPANSLSDLQVLLCANNDDANSALIVACKYGLNLLITSILDVGADINGTMALHAAAKNGNVSIIQILLSNGAEVNYCDNECRTPLHIAVQAGNVHAVKHLLECERIQVDAQDNQGLTPYDYAINLANKDIALMIKDFLVNDGVQFPRKRCILL